MYTLGLGCANADPLLFQQPPDRIARLGADAEPVLDPFAIEVHLSLLVGENRIVGSEFFKYSTVPLPTGIDGRQPVHRVVSSADSF